MISVIFSKIKRNKKGKCGSHGAHCIRVTFSLVALCWPQVAQREYPDNCWIFSDTARGDQKVLSPLCSYLSPSLPVSDLDAFPETKSLWQTFWEDFTYKSEIRAGFSVSLPTQLPDSVTAAFRSKCFCFHSEGNTAPHIRRAILDSWASRRTGAPGVGCEYGSEQWPLDMWTT